MVMENLLNRMQQTKMVSYVCCDEAFKYYEVTINGVVVLFRQNGKRPDGKRLFCLNDALAKLLGFGCIASMMLCFVVYLELSRIACMHRWFFLLIIRGP